MTAILVLGTGSIGKRHIKNILAAGIPAQDLCVVEPRELWQDSPSPRL